MTDEQVKQNAEEYYDKLGTITIEVENEPNSIVEAYIAGAHSRDEEISRLGYINGLNTAELVAKDAELQVLRNPWISVEDRLPEEGQAIIVRLAFGEGSHAACNYSNGQFVWALCIETSNVNIQSMLKLPAITHWMPIPELEKGE